jgi:hypothetical protein
LARSTTSNGRSHYPLPSKDTSRANNCRWTSTIPRSRNTSNITSMHPRVRRRRRSSTPPIGYVSIWHINTTSRSTSSSSIGAWGDIRGNAGGRQRWRRRRSKQGGVAEGNVRLQGQGGCIERQRGHHFAHALRLVPRKETAQLREAVNDIRDALMERYNMRTTTGRTNGASVQTITRDASVVQQQ